MRGTDNSEPSAGHVFSLAKKFDGENNGTGNDSKQEDKSGNPVLTNSGTNNTRHTNLQPVSGSEHTLQNSQQNVVYIQQNTPERVVYVSNHNREDDTRVINVMQGREFHATSNVLGESYNPNKTHDHVVCVTQKGPEEEAEAPNKFQTTQQCMQNNMTERVVYVPKTPEGNISLQRNHEWNTQPINNTDGHFVYVQPNMAGSNNNLLNITSGVNTQVSNNTQERVMYIPKSDSQNNILVGNSLNVPTSESNQMPVRVVYVQGQTNNNVNMQTSTPGLATHASNGMQTVQYIPQHMPPRTPSPSRNHERALQVTQQVVNMAGKMMKQQSSGDNKNPERIVYMTQQTMYSPHMMPQIPYQGGYMPQMQYPNSYMSQQMLQGEAYMPQMYPASYAPPSPRLIHDGVYMASPPDSSYMPSQEYFLPQNLPDVSQTMEAIAPSSAAGNLTDYINTDILDDQSCCSWWDCCSLFSCCCSE